MVSATVLFSLVWQSVGEQSTFASLERDGIRYIQALEPLEIALTNAESVAVRGGSAPREPLALAVADVAKADKELGERLRTEDRWTELRTKVESLPAEGAAAPIIAAYGGVSELLLALMDKVRNTSQLIRDPEVDTYYLEDGAAQELPEGIVAAAQYTDLLLSVVGESPAAQAKVADDVRSAYSGLAGNAKDLSDDIRLAVEGSDGGALGTALLSKLDRFNRSIDDLAPLMSPLSNGTGRIDTAKVVRSRDEMQAAAADLSATLLTQIDSALADRLASLSHRRLLAIGILLAPVLLGLALVVPSLVARRRQDKGAPPRERPTAGRHDPAHPAPAQPVTVPPTPWPTGPVQRPESRPSETAGSEYARWEQFSAPQ
ncbi:hypothetical protein [Paractinoplanes durhamensis]